MEKHIYNEQTGISYTLHGDYYLPDLALSDDEKGTKIGVCGQRHLRSNSTERRCTSIY